MELVTPRLVLREFTAADAPAFAAWQDDPRAVEFAGPDVVSPARAAALVERFVAWSRESPRRDWQLALAARERPALLLGTVGLRTGGLPPGVADFGVELAPDVWGLGYAREAARAMLGWGFATLALAETRADTVSANEPVARLLRGLGFAEAATRPGELWMAERGWRHVEWRLPRARWAGDAAGAAR